MRRTLKLSLFALVLLGLVGGSTAYLLAQKSVTITVDGDSREVSTYAATAGELLTDEGLEVADEDVVLPSVDAPLGDGDTVVLNRARPLELTVDGVTRTITTTALSVDEALAQLGYRDDGLVLSASRSERLPLDGMALQVTTPKTVTVIADGTSQAVTTTAGTAGDLLAEQGLTLSATDRMSLYPTAPLMDRMVLQVWRVQVSQVTETQAVDYQTVETEDPDATKGTRKVTTKGVEGEQTTTFTVTVTDGVETSRVQSDVAVTRQPVDEQVSVGTKPAPTPAPAAAAPSSSSSFLRWRQHRCCGSGVVHRAELGCAGAVRGRRQLVDQHRQRLLRRAAVQHRHVERLRRRAVRLPPGPGHPRAADRDRRGHLRRARCLAVAGLRLATVQLRS